MPKDDYHVITGKILVYLYKTLKNKNKADPGYLTPMTKDFPIDEGYFFYCLEMLERQGFIEVSITRAWGGEIIDIDAGTARMLPAGIEYMKENATMRKVCKTLKEAKGIFSLFQ